MMGRFSDIGKRLAAMSVIAAFCCVGKASGQDSSLLLAAPQVSPSQAQQPLSLQSGSFIYRELPAGARPKGLLKHDIVTVLVDVRTRMLSEGNSQARKTDTLTAVLSDWILFNGKNLKPSPQSDGDPKVAGTYNSQYRAQSNLDTKDTLTFEIGTEIIDIRPNGNLYVEGNQTIQSNENRWKIFVSGEVRREAIMPDRTVSSKAMVNLVVNKEEVGQVRDGYARGWFNRWYDTYKPF
jgi:flagellar L-ring protein precursor FlgH